MKSPALFEDMIIDEPCTEGIKYAGSKTKLIPYILQMVRKVSPKTVLDGFSGTTRVSQALAKSGYQVICNDRAVWSKVFGTCYLLSPYPASHFRDLIAHLNSLGGKDGWFTEHYGGDANHGSSVGADQLKKPWQKHNTRRLDHVLEELDQLKLGRIEQSVALTSLILAMDQVDSTLGHYASYLSDWSPRSYKAMRLRVPLLIQISQDHAVHQSDVFDLVRDQQVDLAYFDPPYGSNNDKMPPSRVRYAAYYHVWTSICQFDRPPVFGKAKRRADTADTVAGSVFEDFRRGANGKFVVVDAIERLLRETSAKHIILSYSSGGRATAEELNRAIEVAGRVIEIMEIDHRKNVMAGMRWTNKWISDTDAKNREFLFLIEK